MYDEKYFKDDTLEFCNQMDDRTKNLMIDAITDLRNEGLE